MKALYSVKHYQMVIILVFNSHTPIRLKIVHQCPSHRFLANFFGRIEIGQNQPDGKTI